MLKLLFNRNWVHKRYKYYEGQEVTVGDDDAYELEALGVAEIVGRKGRPPKRKKVGETFKPMRPKRTGTKVSFRKPD